MPLPIVTDYVLEHSALAPTLPNRCLTSRDAFIVAANRDCCCGVDRNRSLRHGLVVYPSPKQYRSHSSATATASARAAYRELTSRGVVQSTIYVLPNEIEAPCNVTVYPRCSSNDQRCDRGPAPTSSRSTPPERPSLSASSSGLICLSPNVTIALLRCQIRYGISEIYLFLTPGPWCRVGRHNYQNGNPSL
jgi:hypothetical protein